MRSREVNSDDSILPTDEMIVVRGTSKVVTLNCDPAMLPRQQVQIENCCEARVFIEPGHHFVKRGSIVRLFSDGVTVKVFDGR